MDGDLWTSNEMRAISTIEGDVKCAGASIPALCVMWRELLQTPQVTIAPIGILCCYCCKLRQSLVTSYQLCEMVETAAHFTGIESVDESQFEPVLPAGEVTKPTTGIFGEQLQIESGG